MSFQGSLERELEKVNFFPLNFLFVTNTRQVMEHFKLLFGSGNSDLAKTRPLKNWHSPDFLSGFALWNFASAAGATSTHLDIVVVFVKLDRHRAVKC